MFGDGLIRKPIGDMFYQRNGSTTDEQHPVQLYAQAELSAGFRIEPFDQLALGGIDQFRDILFLSRNI